MSDNERLNTVLRGLDPAERQVAFVYAEGEGATWTEVAAGAADPAAFGKRVRRKAKQFAAAQTTTVRPAPRRRRRFPRFIAGPASA
ncbi:hypothetical protein [Streptomyces phaeochromogenes]|uniref:hypothetical protein n=1 Tax=Streptomyces phaeochromogenes TaxID=1923 RepID=UPI0006E1A4F4|nr:hypothetical protein [Streptomyces phaeochromogenes]